MFSLEPNLRPTATDSCETIKGKNSISQVFRKIQGENSVFSLTVTALQGNLKIHLNKLKSSVFSFTSRNRSPVKLNT